MSSRGQAQETSHPVFLSMSILGVALTSIPYLLPAFATDLCQHDCEYRRSKDIYDGPLEFFEPIIFFVTQCRQKSCHEDGVPHDEASDGDAADSSDS